MTVDAVRTRTSRKKACKPEADAQQRLAVEMIEQAREPGLALTGPEHFPTEQAALKCLYLVTRSLDPTGKGQAR